ncbi:hypothetical protein F5Y08DRAFT_173823 [Xylaria arbuscula]|nr:hypothetical protein F5Y08DRAFT_173823 [Xylaria arbuscula]
MDSEAVFNMLWSEVPAFASQRLSYMSSFRRRTRQKLQEPVIANSYEADRMATARPKVPEKSMVTKDQAALATSGIRWRYAEQGMSLHHNAYIDKAMPDLSRKSYIDGVRYALMALPDNLSDQEAASIRGSLPPTVSDAGVPAQPTDRAITWKSDPANQSLLQRCVACLVALLVVVIHIVLSFASVAVRVGAHYERKHNVSQLIISKGFVIASAVGRYSVVLSTKICAMKDRPVGKAFINVVSRALESIASGIQEGIGQGLTIIDDTRPRQS